LQDLEYLHWAGAMLTGVMLVAHWEFLIAGGLDLVRCESQAEEEADLEDALEESRKEQEAFLDNLDNCEDTDGWADEDSGETGEVHERPVDSKCGIEIRAILGIAPGIASSS
jgi:hypothetical protein